MPIERNRLEIMKLANTEAGATSLPSARSNTSIVAASQSTIAACQAAATASRPGSCSSAISALAAAALSLASGPRRGVSRASIPVRPGTTSIMTISSRLPAMNSPAVPSAAARAAPSSGNINSAATSSSTYTAK